jgi:hypothetical protein
MTAAEQRAAEDAQWDRFAERFKAAEAEAELRLVRIEGRLDRIETRLERIERRLGLVGAPAAGG